jgi:hypothetical protein
MSRYQYTWEDSNDPYSSGVPDLVVTYKTKKAALADFREYVNEGSFSWSPKITLWRVTVERVEVK